MKSFFALGLALLFSSCSFFSQSNALILWSGDELMVPTGALGTAQIPPEGAKNLEFKDETTGKTTVLDLWRVRVFPSPEEAQKFYKVFNLHRYWFGKADKPSLVVRKYPAPQAQRVYNLSQNEEIKILDQYRSEIGGWFFVLTQGGLEGWVFQENLSILDKSPGLEPTIIPTVLMDPLLEHFFSLTWRSEDLVKSIKDRSVNLDSLREDHYLRGIKEESTLYLQTPEVRRIFKYKKITQLTEDTYSFEDSGLIIRFALDQKSLTAYFSQNEKDFALKFIQLEEDLGDLIAGERAYRRELYRSLYALGPVLRSPGQGDIYLEKDQRFRWLSGAGAGTSGHPVFQKNYGEFGTVKFLLNLGETLRSLKDSSGTSLYDGVLSLVFDPAPQAPVHFIYKVVKGGLQLWQVDGLSGSVTIDTIGPKIPSYFFSFSRI